MNTRLVMTGAAIFLGMAGVMCLFLPDEILKLYNPSTAGTTGLLIQLLGACFLALALLDWFSKHAVLGGIYGRPVVGTNYVHFVMGSLVMAKAVISQTNSIIIWLTLTIYVLFAIAFSLIMFGKPKLSQGD